MFRRHLLFSSAAGVLALAACGQAAATVTSEILTYVQDIQTGLTALAPVLSTIPGISPAAVNSIESYIAKAVDLALGITSATTAASAQSSIGQIETYVGQALALLSGFALPGGVSTIIVALKVALPFVEAAVAALTSANVGAVPPNAEAMGALNTLGNAKAVLAGG